VRVLVAGTFDPAFARNRVVLALLERGGFDVEVVQRSLWGSQRHLLVDSPKSRLALRAVRAYAGLLWGMLRASRPDVVVVLYPGYFDMPLVAAVARLWRVPVLFDTFISLHDTVVGDRALRRPGSLVGRATRLADRIACRAADLVLADTPAHADYFASLTGVDRGRFRVLWLGAQEDVFAPVEGVAPEPRLVFFHGTFIPLQGLATIVRAAKLLESDGIRFRVVGDGQERANVEALVNELDAGNVELCGLLPLDRIPGEIASASLCLGIFGTSAKAGRVVPNKVFECLAVGRPVLTGDTPAIRSAFDGEVAVSPPGDAPALAAAIRELVEDAARLDQLAVAGHARFERDYSEAALEQLLSEHISDLAGRSESARGSGLASPRSSPFTTPGRRMRRTSERHSPDQVASAEEREIDARLHYAYGLVEEYVSTGDRLLDVGSGEGYGSSIVKDWVREYRGVDLSISAVEHAQERYGGTNVAFDHADGDGLPYPDATFDLVTSFHTIEHVENVPGYLAEIRRVVDDHAYVLVTTPNRTLRLDEGERPWNRYHLREYDAEELRDALGDHFGTVELFGIRGSAAMEELEHQRLANARRMARIDRFGLRYLLPETIDTPIRRMLRSLTRHRAPLTPFSVSDVWRTPEDLDHAIDLLAVAQP
jgi:glycosyltransferase involved in cell wall biosynthesis/SAM-dependent methyltransferase